MLREIPATATEIQTGLWADQKTVTLGSMTRVKYNLYSSEGYCFYVIANCTDQDGNLIPENDRIYYQYMSTAYTSVEQINAEIVSVPVQPGYEISSAGSNDHVVA